MKRIFIFAIVVLMVLSIVPTHTYADNEDFEVAYAFNPELIGAKGADVSMLLTIRNMGTTDITWIDVVINNTETYFQRWTGTIRPGSIRRLRYVIPFASSDLNVNRFLQVSMNNDVDTNNDGVKMFEFQLEGTEDIFGVDASRAPHSATYEPGDSITVEHDFTNLFETHAATDVITNTYLVKDGDKLVDRISVYQGDVFPSNTISDSFTHTFDEDDVGRVEAFYRIQFTMMGQEYVRESATMAFDVLRGYEIDFRADLTASPTEIYAGDLVTFEVNIHNDGSDVERFEIRNDEGGVMASTESLPAGSSGSVAISANIYESCDVSYIVIGYISGDHISKETNSVRITVREPETATPEPTMTPNPTGATAPTPTVTTEETTKPADTPVTDEVKPAATKEEAAGQGSENRKELRTLIVLLIVVALILLVLVGVLVYMRKK